MKIKDFPRVDRPQEKLFRYNDPARLTNEELLAIILRTGIPKLNVLQLSKKLSSHIFNGKKSEIKNIKGVGPTKKAQLIALREIIKRCSNSIPAIRFAKPKDVWADLVDIRSSKKEQFVGYYLDTKNALIKRETISIGTLSSSLVHPREVFEPAIRYSCARVILAHNHPSGDPTPSQQDIQATIRLSRAGILLDIDILDHIIVTPNTFLSMREKGHVESP